MKKILALLAAIAALTSCSVKEPVGPERTADSPILHASFEGMDDTRTFVGEDLRLFWTADDRISVFPGTTDNLQYRFLGETCDRSGDFEEVTPSGARSGSDVSAIYAVYPYQPTAGLSAGGAVTVELPSVQQYAPGTFGPGANTMVAVSSDLRDDFLYFRNVCGYIVVKLYGDETVKSVTIEGNNGEKLAGRATVSASHSAAPTLTLAGDATTSITIDCGEGVRLGASAEAATEFWFCIPPVTFSKGFTITATGSAGSFSKSTTSSRTVERNVRVSMPALEFIPEGPAVPEAVDLGLPSGIKWASFNLGATKPEEYGGYYQWGGLEDVTDTSIYLDLDNCPYHTGTNQHTGWTKYIPSNKPSYWSGAGTPDNKTVLGPADDVAHVNLGGSWRMPSKEDFDELIDNCTSEWTTMNGVSGRKFTSNKNGNSIFLPAAGFRCDVYLELAGSYGSYWSSSLYTSYPFYACLLKFADGYVYTDFTDRCNGRPVRPVYGDIITATGITLDKTSLPLSTGEDAQLTATLTPSDCFEQGLVWSSDNPSVATVSANGLVTAYSVGTAVITVSWAGDSSINAACTVTVTGTPVVSGMVDLGLPSGIKWATCNLGASKPEEYGGYYQWGGLEDVTDTGIYLNWDNCPYHTGSDMFTGWTKYIPSNKSSCWSGSGSPDNRTILDLEDDVAHVKLGGKWRMPTDAEFKELNNNCTSEWTTLNGVIGQKYTSKTNGNSIFLPAAGARDVIYIREAGSHGFYWSSSRYMYEPYNAFIMSFSSGGTISSTDRRKVGHSVRPVYGSFITATGITLDKTSLSLSTGKDARLKATLTPSDCFEQGLVWSSDNPSVATVSENGVVVAKSDGTAVITVSWAGDGSINAACAVTVTDTSAVPEMVDLGLSVKWASFNLGASKPEEYGGYYQWGGLEDVTDTGIYLNWDNCPYHTGSDMFTGWTKYIPSYQSSYWSGAGSPDNKTVLDPEDDVVRVKLGGSWRMPTKEEFDELRSICTSEWVTMNGVPGLKFTSNKNGNSIFLPAAGYRYCDYVHEDGSYGCYWSSSLGTNHPSYGYQLIFSSDYLDTDYDYRYGGLSVRPVSE